MLLLQETLCRRKTGGVLLPIHMNNQNDYSKIVTNTHPRSLLLYESHSIVSNTIMLQNRMEQSYTIVFTNTYMDIIRKKIHSR